MQVPILLEYKLDIDGTLPDNYITNEPVNRTSSKNNRVFIPQHAPFYIQSVVLTDMSGQPYKLDKDYRFFNLMPDLTAYTAKPVGSCIEVLNGEAMTDMLITYHVVGDTPLIDKSILAMADALINNTGLVDYDNIIGKPDYFPPSYHTHSLRFDYYAFTDFLKLVDMCIDIFLGRDDLNNTVIQAAYDKFMHYLNLYKEQVTEMFTRHINAHNAHGLTKNQISLDLLDNTFTATPVQAKEGIRDDLRLTPEGLNEIVKDNTFKANEFVESGLLPIVVYGRDTYIPPSIDGSYEAAGTDNSSAAICLEDNGDLMFLNRRIDGRVIGLYYEAVENYLLGNRDGQFTSFRYTHPRASADSVNLDMVVAGSNDKIMMVGGSTAGKYYITATNGTLSPSKHILVPVDLTTITGFNPQYGTIHLIDDYIIYIQSGNYQSVGGADNSGQRFFKASASLLTADTHTIAFTLMTLSYKDVNGLSFTDPVFSLSKVVYDNPTTKAHITRYIFNFVSPCTSIRNHRRMQILSTSKRGSRNVASLHFFTFVDQIIQEGGSTVQPSASFQAMYELDIANNTLMPNANNIPAADLVTDPLDWNNPSYYPTKWKSSQGWGTGYMCSSYAYNAVSYISTGDVITHNCSGVEGPPLYYTFYNFSGGLAAYDINSQLWDTTKLTWTNAYRYFPTQSGTLSSVNCTLPFLDDNYEMYAAWAQEAGSGSKLWLKKWNTGVDTTFQVRPEVGSINPSVTTLYSRPLSNKIYSVNLQACQPKINLTGDAAALTTMHRSVGWGGFAIRCDLGANSQPSVGGANNTDGSIKMCYKANPVFADATSTATFDPASIGNIIYPKSIIDTLKGLVIPAAQQSGTSMVCTIADMTGNVYTSNGGDVLPNVALIQWTDPTNTAGWQAALAIFTSTYTDIDTQTKQVTGITLLDSFQKLVNNLLEYPTTVNVNCSPTDPVCAYLAAYISGTTVQYQFTDAVNREVIGNRNCLRAAFTVDLTTNKFTVKDIVNSNWTIDIGCFTSIPKVGIKGLEMSWQSEAGAAATYVGSGTSTYLISSTYPDPQFTIFFKTNETVMVAGRVFSIPKGTIDLRNVVDDPTNKTFYIYLLFTDGAATYYVTTSILPETGYCACIGMCVTNATSITSLTRERVFSLNGFRVGEDKHGSTLPASSGSILTEGSFPWFTSTDVLSG